MTIPTLILHGTRDTSPPFELSSRLRVLRPAIVDLQAFNSDHTMTWNSDQERWREILFSWLAALGSP